MGRHLTTLRNFYGFLLREGLAERDPTEHLRSPKQWQTIPKFLNLEEIGKLIGAPDTTRPTGLRDRAMLELLYASGLRVSELCHVGMSDLNLDLVNAYRATLGLAALSASSFDSSRFNSFDILASRPIFVKDQRRLELGIQVFNLFGTQNLVSFIAGIELFVDGGYAQI